MPARIDTERITDNGGDPVLSKLRLSDFDPVEYLNDILPTLNLSSQSQTSKGHRSSQIQGASSEALAQLSSVNALQIRASSELTSLTDEIIRSGNRLAYEVEVLRGDVNGIHELLTESLREEIGQFIRQDAPNGDVALLEAQVEGNKAVISKDEPECMSQLRSLGKVKSRLESVIVIFGEAMKWPMPPSELSMASSLISVSSPELGMQSTAEDDKAHEVLKGIRAEINELLASDTGDHKGLEAASRRVEHYRQLALLWKGTGEEKARAKFVDSLAKLVEDRRKTLDARGAGRNLKGESIVRPSSAMSRNAKGSGESGGAAGLFRNLQRLKDDLYLE